MSEEQSQSSTSSGSSIGFWLMAAAVLLLAYALFWQKRPGIERGKPAPRMKLTRMSDGQKQLAPTTGQLTVVHFWASWCRVCVQTLVSSSHRAKRLAKKGVRYMMVNLDQPASTKALRQFLTHRRVGKELWPYHYRDAAYQAVKQFNVNVYPSMVIINRKGEVEYYIQGALPDRSLQRLLQPLGFSS
ncbi:MAG: TlpA family protein disulfide reductase [Deltaproteobacteria bacterium]|nr:MAG: TlpA family protein disulfide reductase [Deltaproteobacteria bacterium]